MKKGARQMNLGELEFTVDDLSDLLKPYSDGDKAIIMQRLNKRLKEKLVRCQVVHFNDCVARLVVTEPLEPPDSMDKLVEDIASFDLSRVKKPRWIDLDEFIERARKLRDKGGE